MGFIHHTIRGTFSWTQCLEQNGLFLQQSLPTRFEYEYIDGSEQVERYRPGGYHPIVIGDKIHNRYEITGKLGYGGWSTVWLAYDSREKRHVALKIGIADSLMREIPALRALKTANTKLGPIRVTPMLDVFTVDGPNGSHPCYTTTLALCNLRECSFSRLFRLDVARSLAYRLALAVAYIHSQGIVHGGETRGCVGNAYRVALLTTSARYSSA